MSDKEFRSWVHKLRHTVVDIWDNDGCPPVVGKSQNEIISVMNDMIEFDTSKFLHKCELDGSICIKNNQFSSTSAVNQFFPTMMKTPITYTDSVKDAQSIYDWFSKEELYERHLKYCYRHFKRDSFYNYSLVARVNDRDHSWIAAENGAAWIKEFEKTWRKSANEDYWLCPVKEDGDYTGYNEELKDVQWLRITQKEVDELGALIPDKCKVNMNQGSHGDSDVYSIRFFKYGQKMFPLGFKAFRISYCQSVANFPPLTAKYLFDKYTEDFEDEETINIWDPSAGWGGRIMGAMCIDENRKHIHYIGNDPNKDHTIRPGYTKYDALVDFFHTHSLRGQALPGISDNHEHTIIQRGSEVIKDDSTFQSFKGKIHLVMTSPPYFAKEVYSDDPEQSCHKFSTYEIWRDEFLRVTLETAVEWLIPGGHLIWNIADAKFGNEMLPLEEDSCSILRELGMVHIRTEKMTLAPAPGGNRMDPETGRPKFKNACRINNKWLKYEPCFVFQKPK